MISGFNKTMDQWFHGLNKTMDQWFLGLIMIMDQWLLILFTPWEKIHYDKYKQWWDSSSITSTKSERNFTVIADVFCGIQWKAFSVNGKCRTPDINRTKRRILTCTPPDRTPPPSTLWSQCDILSENISSNLTFFYFCQILYSMYVTLCFYRRSDQLDKARSSDRELVWFFRHE